MTTPEVHIPQIRGLAEWILTKGFLPAFAAIVLVLAVIYFIRLMFTKTSNRKLDEIWQVVMEIKLKLDRFLEGGKD